MDGWNMTLTVQRRRIEILVDQPLMRRIVEIAREIGIKGYTVLPTLCGEGTQGPWSDDLISGAQQKVLFLAVMSDTKAALLIEQLTPLLESHGLVLLSSIVDVVRPEKYD